MNGWQQLIAVALVCLTVTIVGVEFAGQWGKRR